MIGELTTSEVDILIILKIYHDNHILIAFMSHLLFFQIIITRGESHMLQKVATSQIVNSHTCDLLTLHVLSLMILMKNS